MPLLSLKNVKFKYADRVILDDVSFNIDMGDKIGLVGHNGSGKSTLLKCLMDELEIDEGKILKSKNLHKIGYIEQDVPADLEDKTLYDALLEKLGDDKEYSSWKVDVALGDIQAPEEMWHKPISELSGGWRRLALIARTNLDDPDMLILDEPTNHLDLEKIIQLEKWLKNNVTVPYLLVSHDRQLLDNVTNRTVTLRAGEVIDFSVPYSKAKELIAEQDELDASRRAREEGEIMRLEAVSRRMMSWGIGNAAAAKKGKAVMKRVDRLKDDTTSVHREKKRSISLSQGTISSSNVLNINNTPVTTPSGELLFTLDKFHCAKGDKIVILGQNGTGKSQFLKKVIEAFDNPSKFSDTEGGANIKFNPQVKVGYFDQNLSSVPNDSNLYDYLASETKAEEGKIIAALANAGFPYKIQQDKIGKLSFGERTRLLFLQLNMRSVNFFMLDEPTNHLDIDGQDKLQSELSQDDSTCIFVSHDRYFVKNVANRFLLIEDNKISEIHSVDDFYDKLLKK